MNFFDRGERQLTKFVRAHLRGEWCDADEMVRSFPEHRLVRLCG